MADINALRTFLAVYRAGTFTRAPPALPPTHPPVLLPTPSRHAPPSTDHPERCGGEIEGDLKGLTGRHRLYPVVWEN